MSVLKVECRSTKNPTLWDWRTRRRVVRVRLDEAQQIHRLFVEQISKELGVILAALTYRQLQLLSNHRSSASGLLHFPSRSLLSCITDPQIAGSATHCSESSRREECWNLFLFQPYKPHPNLRSADIARDERGTKGMGAEPSSCSGYVGPTATAVDRSTGTLRLWPWEEIREYGKTRMHRRILALEIHKFSGWKGNPGVLHKMIHHFITQRGSAQ